MATMLKLMTAEELLLLPDDGMQRELIRGVLTEDMPPGDEHGVLVAHIAWLLTSYAYENSHGQVRAGDSGFVLEHDPDTVRGPDVAWVSSDRLSAPVVGYADLAPDLVVEVKSPSNSNREMADRALMWLSHGTRMAVVADPARTTLTVYLPGQPPQVLGDFDVFDGGDILPGFSEQVWRFFRPRE